MCGIAGVYEYATGRPVERQTLLDMLSVIRHRGPDDEGTYQNNNLAMGMRRLSIIDLPGGKQPISNEDGSVTVVFNGEIYNYLELREKLLARGHRLVTASDTEVIVHLYEELGEDCVRELRGMFAFALWDATRRRLFIARDRLGIKPLYYLEHRGRLIFASEIKAILQHPGVTADLNMEALSHFLSLKYVPAPQTMFAGIHALPPGHAITCDGQKMEVRSYWRLSFARGENYNLPEEECADRLEELLRECVKLHLVSDVPFGAFLSGGVDSSTIVALMSQLLDKPVKTFSVGFDGDGAGFSELPYARLVSKRYETEHHEILVRPCDLTNLAEKVIWHLDQPIADNACVANYMVAELASRHVKMVLTGEGGDELFAGYARYAGEAMWPWFRHIPAPARSLAMGISKRIPGLRREKLALFALCQADEATRFTNWVPLFNREMRASLLSDQFKRALPDTSTEAIFAKHLAATDATHPLHRMLYVDTKLWLPDDLLARGDKTSMASSLEARVPLLDHKLVEFAASLPPHMKLKGLTRKYLLKKVARRWLPAEVVDRKKEGFPMPFSIWFRKEARGFVRDLLSPATIKRRGFFDAAYIEKLLQQHEAGVADHGSLLWGLLSVELWHRIFLDSAPTSFRQHGEIPIAAGR
jgi:asparagine synthase (glutamine-hydrolysing)